MFKKQTQLDPCSLSSFGLVRELLFMIRNVKEMIEMNSGNYDLWCVYRYIYISGGWLSPTPLKNDGVRQLGWFFPTEWKQNPHVPNHQPAYSIHGVYIYSEWVGSWRFFCWYSHIHSADPSPVGWVVVIHLAVVPEQTGNKRTTWL